ncbi:MAG: hypothetical protein FJW26_03170 [Acidimicrobiia bacterium]|nr:hypothetical protein [Acidimicrobiia bacterium]
MPSNPAKLLATLPLAGVILLGFEESPKVSGEPVSPVEFKQMRITEAWAKYDGVLTWGKGQCLAILDDGCDLKAPEWQVSLPWGKKVVAGYDSIDRDDDPTPVPPGYHGTSVGFPSSLNYQGKLGVAFNNQIAPIRALRCVGGRCKERVTPERDAESLAAGLRWVIDNHARYNITAVNLSPGDGQRHQQPVPTVIDKPLKRLKKLGIWVSSPCGNAMQVEGISWPACQRDVFGVGATKPGEDIAHLSRYRNADILVPALYTSSSNAFIAGAAMVLREAIMTSQYRWKNDGHTLPEAMMSIFQKTGAKVEDPESHLTFSRLDLLAALDYVYLAKERTLLPVEAAQDPARTAKQP